MNRGFWTVAILLTLVGACGGGSSPDGEDPSGGDIPGDPWLEVLEDTGQDAFRPDQGLDAGPEVPGDLVPGEVEDPGADGEIPCEVGETLARGLAWLENGEPGLALNNLEEALERCPSDPTARYLAGLAETIYGTEHLVSLLTVLTGQTTGPKLAAAFAQGDAPRDPASWNEILAEKLHRALLELRNHFVRGLAHLEAVADRAPEVTTAGIPLYLGIRPTLVLRGRFDRGDVLLTRAVATFAAATLDVFAGQDLNTDLLTVISSAESLFEGSVNFPVISRLVAYLLNEDARFLTLHPEDGEFLFRDARQRFAEIAPLLDQAIQHMGYSAEGEVSFIEDLPAGVAVHVRNRIRWDSEGTFTEEPWYLILGEETLEAMRSCSRSIQNPGEGVTLHGGVIPTLSTLLVGLVRVGLLEIFQLGEVAGIDLTTLEVDEVSGLLTGLLPNVIAFDWGRFFERPVGLRAWLPEVTRDRPALDNRIRAEWECPEELSPDGFPSGSLRMLCSKTATLVDDAHFLGTEWETTPDSYASPFPVMAFSDPTWNDLLWVNLEAPARQEDLEGYQLANQTTWNAALGRLLGGILSLLN